MGKSKKKSGSRPGKMDPPPFHGSPEHLWNADNNQSNTLILHLSTLKVGVSLFQHKTGRIVSLRTDGSETGPNFPTANVFDQYSFPFLMALPKDRVFLKGFAASQAIMDYENLDCSHKIHIFQLGRILANGSTHGDPLLVPHSEGKSAETRLELLLHLYFQDLLFKVESFKWDKRQQGLATVDNRIIVCVPLWWSSGTRQRLLSTAELMGLQFDIINENTAAAYIHHQLYPSVAQGKKGAGKTDQKFMIWNENGGNVDLAIYTAVGKKIKMEMCLGNMYLSQKRSNKDQEYKLKYNENRDCPQARKELVRGLLAEVERRLPARLVEGMKIVVQGEDPKWQKIVSEEIEAKAFFKNIKVEPNPPESEAGPRYLFWHDVDYTRVLKDLCGPNVRDLNPYPLMARHGTREYFWEVEDNHRLLDLEIGNMDKVLIFERHSTGHEATLLQVHFLFKMSKPSKVTIKMKWDQMLNIYRFGEVFGPGGKKQEEKDFVLAKSKLPEKMTIPLTQMNLSAWKYEKKYMDKLWQLNTRYWELADKLEVEELADQDTKWEQENIDTLKGFLYTGTYFFDLETLDELLEATGLIEKNLDEMIAKKS